MNRLIFIFSICMFFSCQNENGNFTSSIQEKHQIEIVDTVSRRKFSAPINFDEYRVDIYRGKIAEVNYSSNQTAFRFRSAIKWAIDSFGVNFGGRYNLSRWGCGTSCKNGAITDLKTGQVYDLPSATIDYEFRRDSKLLVINPPDSNGYFDNCSYCEPELWIWNDSKRKFDKVN